jgi:phage shock protein PspC (stress-responsive transcriptional regulator)
MKNLFRIKGNGSMLGGVMAGFAESLNIDVTVLRILAIGGFFTPIPVVFIYIIFWAVMPVQQDNYITTTD